MDAYDDPTMIPICMFRVMLEDAFSLDVAEILKFQQRPSCSKLMMSLVNISLKVKTLIIKYSIYANIFAEKMCVAFAFTKATHIFLAKIPVN